MTTRTINPAHRHPRRSPRLNQSTEPQQEAIPLPTLNTRSLPKAPTYHPTRSPISTGSPAMHMTSLPARSCTSAEELDKLVQMSERAIVDLIGNFDKGFTGLGEKPQPIRDTRSVFTVPAFIERDVKKQTSTQLSPDDIQQSIEDFHDSFSDSGLGSSIASSDGEDDFTFSKRAPASASRHATRQTRLPRAEQFTRTTGLSQHASRQIKRYILNPILQEDDLTDYHDLVKQIPTRIASRSIQTLRDLEKTMIFLAPAKARSPASYLRFCEFSIQAVHTAVDHINVLDQVKPTDRPYNNLYFVDLVEQVRQYARIMAITRKKKAAGEALDEHDHQEGETLKLVPGNATRPAELVRQRVGGKSITIDSVRESVPLTSGEDSELDIDGRTMARKRKCDQGKVEYRSCRECGKQFTRPCDLTKHEKTHSRPWKCPEPDCRYHEDGWPTEKECERHVNDKHASQAKLYKCLYEPCPYTSKRESNCKQHMEKAHGWKYDRARKKGEKGGEKLVPIMVPNANASSRVILKPRKVSQISSYASSSSHSPIVIDDDDSTPGMSPDATMEYSSGPSSANSPMESTLNDFEVAKLFGADYNNNNYFTSPPGFAFEQSIAKEVVQSPAIYTPTYTPTSGLDDQFTFGDGAYTNFTENFQIYQPQVEQLPSWPTPEEIASYDQMLQPTSSKTLPAPATTALPDFEEWLNSLPPQYPAPGISPVEDFALYDEPSLSLTRSNDTTLLFPELDTEMTNMQNTNMAQPSAVGMKYAEDPMFGDWVNLDDTLEMGY